jgi:hypothetical protein
LLVVKRGLTAKLAVATGLALGAIALSKPNTYLLSGVLLCAVCLSGLLYRPALKDWLNKTATVLAIASAMALPLFVRNWLAFAGDVLGMRTMHAMWCTVHGAPVPLYHFPVVDSADWRYCLFVSYVGNLGNLTRLLPEKIYKLFSIAIKLCCAGWAVSLVLILFRQWRQSAGLPSRFKNTVSGLYDLILRNRVDIALWSLTALTLVLSFATLLAGSLSFNSNGQPQGRYIFPAEVAISAFLIGGLSRLGGRPLVIAFLALNLFATVYSLAMLYPVYHFDVNIMR